MRFPRVAVSVVVSGIVGLFMVVLTITGEAWAAPAVGRDRLPVVIKGRDLLWVNYKNLTQIYLYRYDPAANPPWIPIPFQIDKRRKINFIHNVGTPNSVADPTAQACALSYFPPRYCSSWTGAPYDGTVQECPLNYGAAFQSDILGPTDEVVFMARDLGTARDIEPFEWLPDAAGLDGERLELMVPDDANGDGVIGSDEKFWVYAYLWSQPPTAGMKSTAPPPTWQPDVECRPCTGLPTDPPNTFHEDCGTFRGPSSGPTREGYEVHTLSNWQYNDFKVIPASSSTPGDDLLHSWNMSAGTETNLTWDCSGLPRPMDVKVPGPGQVRVIRGIQGSASGASTMKYDKAYDSAFETEVELRVHELGDLVLNQGHNVAVKNGGHAAAWAKSVIDAGPPPVLKLWDPIDGVPPTATPTPNADDWWQMIDLSRGGTASFSFQDASRGPIQADSTGYNYIDLNTEPFGNFGRRWGGLSCMQDGTSSALTVNDGGCPAGRDPEAPDLLFKRLVRVTIPTAAANERDFNSVRADEWEYAVRNPLISGTTSRQCKDGSCGGVPPVPFCPPTLNTTLKSDGSVDLAPSLSTGPDCSSSAGTFGLTVQLGAGAETIAGYVLPGSTYRFRNVVLGVPHVFRTFALAADGRISSKSQPVSVTPSDTTAPPPPLVENVQGLAGGMSVDFQTCRDIAAQLVKVYLSETSGGPYVQANQTPILVSSPHHVVISGLIDGRTYFGVMTMVDRAGNESVYSPQFAVTVGP